MNLLTKFLISWCYNLFLMYLLNILLLLPLPSLSLSLGLLLQKIKGFWRAALLLSMLLYPIDVDSSTSAYSQIELDKRRAALFKMIEIEIIKLGNLVFLESSIPILYPQQLSLFSSEF